jgi:hypothetical protein
MPNPTEVAIIKRDGSILGVYTTYADARANAVSGDLIQIRADLNEQIVLLDGVDIWIMPGVIVNNSSGNTITDINIDTSLEVHCKIYGYGKIVNTGTHSCVFINHVDSELSIECDYIENIGSSLTSICIEIFNAHKFHLLCNRVSSQKGVAIWLGRYDTTTHTLLGFIEDVNLNVSKVETGVTGFGSTAFISLCNGFIKINEIAALYNRGHCFSHRAGDVIARIKKMTTVMISSLGGISTVHTSQGTSDKKLVLYFDEIINKFGSSTVNASLCIEHHQGTGIFIGRKINTITNSNLDSIAIQISREAVNDLPKGYVKINEIICTGGTAMVLNDFNEQITIDANYIESNGSVVIYSAGSSTERANFFIRNAKIKNKSASPSAKGILFQNVHPIATLSNVKIVSGSDDGSNIYLADGNSIDVYNYGLFGNEGINPEKINLKIGTWTEPEEDYNYQCIISSDLN